MFGLPVFGNPLNGVSETGSGCWQHSHVCQLGVLGRPRYTMLLQVAGGWRSTRLLEPISLTPFDRADLLDPICSTPFA